MTSSAAPQLTLRPACHPGYVPDDYLEHPDGLGIETTITSAELCAIGTWQRVDGGYRVLNWEAVEYALDGVRRVRGEDPMALAAERDHEAKAWAHMAAPMVVTPPCAACGTPSVRVELVAPGQVPAEWDQWPAPCRPASCGDARRDSGICCSKASLPTTATATPSTPAEPAGSPRHSGLPCTSPRSTPPGSTTMQVFCQDCDAPYCYRHWHVTESGYGYCPHGHTKSLDPRW
jgi:hypothetical protein